MAHASDNDTATEASAPARARLDALASVPWTLNLPRDITGYGPSPPSAPWPNNARIAISFVLNYEEGAELSFANDGRSEAFLWEWASTSSSATTTTTTAVATTATEETSTSTPKRNFIAEQDYEYGSRVGCWRILGLLSEFGVKGSLFLVAEAGEQNRAFVKACVDTNWELVCHGVRWVDTSAYSLEEDAEYIAEAARRVGALGGRPPAGVYLGRVSDRARALYPKIWEMLGHELLYSSESYNDDVPYWVDLPWEDQLLEMERKGLLIVPYNQDCNDASHLIAPGFTSSAGDTYTNYLISTFECLYREGGKIMNVPLHARISGKPGRSEALRKFLEYVTKREGVWFATREEIAEVWKRKYPYASQEGGKGTG